MSDEQVVSSVHDVPKEMWAYVNEAEAAFRSYLTPDAGEGVDLPVDEQQRYTDACDAGVEGPHDHRVCNWNKREDRRIESLIRAQWGDEVVNDIKRRLNRM